MSRTRNRSISVVVAEASSRQQAGVADEPRAPAPNPVEHETARRMLEIAERLFAEQGVELVPLRQIVVEAGQRNRSALHYHFGSREALVGHLLNYRLGCVNRLREQYLDELEASGDTTDVRAVVRASVRALSDTMRQTEWGPRYVQVLAQTMFSPQLFNAELIEPQAITGVVRARRMLAAAMPDLPKSALEARLLWFNQGVVFSLATWYQLTQGESEEPPVEELVDFYSAALSGKDYRQPAEKGKTPRRAAAKKTQS